MKWNWGHNVTVLYLSFVVLILVMVYKSMQHDIELVSEDYYAQELKYQQIIEQKNNVKELDSPVIIQVLNKTQIQIKIPTCINKHLANIQLDMQRPSNEHLDVSFDLTLDSDGMAIAEHPFKIGLYNAVLTWTMNDKKYLKQSQCIFR
ncbi:MAG TPA: FixH family protein [Bacteroidia bacterium]|nr:FixH family protein [Bacteroidia bacterium]